MVFQKTSELLESQVDAALTALKIARSELQSQQKCAPVLDLRLNEASRQRAEIQQSEEEEKKAVKRSVGRPPKNRVIESSSAGSENKVSLGGVMRKSRYEDTQPQNEIITIEDAHMG